MTKAKKLVALMLAFLMIFSSVSVLASAMSDTVDGGVTLGISTKFFKEVDGVWTETTKVNPKETDTVKARVYLETDYYSGDSTLLFFYDKDFFTHNYAEAGQVALAINPAATNGVTGYFVTNANLQGQVDAGYISADQLNEYGVFAVNLATNGTTVKHEGSDWLFEFELEVLDTAAGEGDLFTVEEFYQTTTRTKALGDVPKGVAGGASDDAWSMWVWDATFDFESQPISTISSVTFDANGGTFAGGAETFGPLEGTISETIAADALPANPSYEGYTFLGWVDAEIANPTQDDIVAAPSVYPDDDLVLNAYWIKNVNITFADTGDSTIDPITNVTPNTAFKEIADPTKAGYTFVGWDVRGGELPDVYPTADTTYTAIWATNVEVSFEMNGADPVGPFAGYDGAPFEETIETPKKTGHYFVGWLLKGEESKGLQPLPTVYPATDVTYVAVFDTYTYYVTYIVKNEKTGETQTYFLQTEYDAEIGFPRVAIPEGYSIDSQWYTDEACSVPFVEGTKMGTAPITLYTTIDTVPYKAYFMLEEGDDIADAYEVVDVIYGEEIVAPATNPTKGGYNFGGWTPYVGIHDKESDVYFYATWVEKVGNVKYMANDGTDAVVEVYDIPYGFDLEIPADPTREGYTFLGWNTDANATSALAIDGTKMPEIANDGDEIVYYAVWQINEYKVTFDSNQGSAVEDKTQAYNSEVTAPTEPTRPGYKFLGWTDADGDTVTFPFSMPAYDVALTASWKQEEYVIRYLDTGDNEIEEKIVVMGQKIEVPTGLTKEGEGLYFTGWDVTPPTEIGDMGNDGQVFEYTAQWAPESYTIIYKDTGDTSYENKVVKKGDTIEIPSALTKEGQGYYFTAWDTTPPTAIGDMGDNGDTFTYTAQWEKESYVLKFANTGDTKIADKNVTFGDTIEATAAPEWAGHVFAGWDVTPPTEIGDLGDNGEAITYTAKWTVETYIFHFTNTGDNAVEDATVTFGQDYAAPTGLTKPGYTHIGWDPAVPTKIEDLGADKAEFTFAAQWSADDIAVTFDANGGKFADDATTTQVNSTFDDAAINLPANPAKPGYGFVGWSTDKDAKTGSMSLGKLDTTTPPTYYAIWSADSVNYTVEFWYMDVDGQGYTRDDSKTLSLPGVVDTLATYAAATTETGFKLNVDESTLEGTVPAEGTLVLSAYYDRDQYTLTYEGNAPVQVYFDAEIPAAVVTPEKEGNYFVKWQNDLVKMPASDLDIAAEWALEEYTITFTDLYGNAVENIVAKYGDAITVPAGLVREGYVFAGWKNAAGDALTTPVSDLGNNGDTVAFAAQWTLDQFTITIKLDGGNIEGKTDDIVITKDFGDAVDKPAKPVKEGYAFVDWNVTIPDTMPAEDMTITAIWKTESYTVVFADTDDDGKNITVPVSFGGEITVPTDLTKTGKVFAGWKDADGNVATPPTSIGDLGEDGATVVYTAQWTDETYTIVFADTNDAGDDITVPATFGGTITVPTGLVKTGHVFAGWTDAAGKDAVPPTSINDLGENNAVITYTAKWTKETYTLKFANTGDTVIADKVVTFGETIEAVADPEWAGYKFIGWDVTPPTTIGDLGENGAVITYTAKWNNDTFKVTWTDESGSTTVDVVFGDAIVAPTPAEKEGYYFVKWTPDVPATMPAENLEFTALYEVSVYYVNFYINGVYFSGYGAEYGDEIRTEGIGYTVPLGYEFDGWYTNPECTEKFVSGTVGAQVTNLYAKETVGTYAANFYLDEAKTELHYTVNVQFDKEIKLPAELATPTKEGYTFAGWEPIVGIMDAEGKDFVAIWNEDDTIVVTYYVDGEVYESFDNQTFGGEYDIPADPYKKGHKFEGWAVKGTTDIVDIRTLAVAAEGAEFDAIFTVTAFTVNYFVYEESEHGPAGTPAPGYIVYADAEGNAITGTYSLGDAIAHPAAPEIEFYTFAGWVDAEGNEWAEGAEMPAEEVNLYATYERVAVKLVAQEGSTTVVTRGTDTATYKDFFLTGFALRPSVTQAVLESTYVDIVGDGTITVKPVGSNRNLGTGAIVTLTDNVTGEVAEQFYVVIYGDLDGNGRINAADSTILKSEAASPVWSVRNSPNRVEYLVKAADLDGNRRINASDSNLLIGVAASKYTINQQTGKAS